MNGISSIEQKQAMLAAIIESSNDAIIGKDLNSRITSWNKAAERMFGYTESEMLGELIHKLIPDDRLNEEDVIISQLRAGKRLEHFETIRRTKSGKLLQLSLTISPIISSNGEIIGASKIARDITQQKKNEERLRLINMVGSSIAAHLDIDKILQVVTDATTTLSGASFGAFFYNKVDAKGETYTLYALSGASREAFEKLGMPRNTEIFNPTFEGTAIIRSDDITKDPRYGKNAPHRGMPKGHLPVVSYLAVPVISQSGTVIGGLFFGHPEPGVFLEEHEQLVVAIAAQAAIALDNAKLYQEISILNGKKDQFIGFASHELKTPLTTIKGYLQVAQMTNMPPEEFIPKLTKQVTRLESIIDDLLNISKIQAGKMDFKFERSDLQTLVKECIDGVDVTKHRVTTELPKETVPIIVDFEKMCQVVVYLLANAVKYSAPGSEIRIEGSTMGDEAHISITDQGIGIPKEEQDKIFNQFYRTSSSMSNAKGMGLGLYIAREIMEAHFGKISVESEPGVGSTFHIHFPVDRVKK